MKSDYADTAFLLGEADILRYPAYFEGTRESLYMYLYFDEAKCSCFEDSVKWMVFEVTGINWLYLGMCLKFCSGYDRQ